jgi:ribosomal protein S16
VFSDLDIVFSLLHRDYIINEGKNLTVPCDSDNPSIWARDGSKINSNYNVIIVSVRHPPMGYAINKNSVFSPTQDDSFLTLINITSEDAGLYICSVLTNFTDTESSYQELVHAQVRVRTKPGEEKMPNGHVLTR